MQPGWTEHNMYFPQKALHDGHFRMGKTIFYERAQRVRYCFHQEKISFLSSRGRAIFFALFTKPHSVLFTSLPVRGSYCNAAPHHAGRTSQIGAAHLATTRAPNPPSDGEQALACHFRQYKSGKWRHQYPHHCGDVLHTVHFLVFVCLY